MLVFKVQRHRCHSRDDSVVIATVPAGNEALFYVAALGWHTVIFLGDFKISTSTMCFLHKHQRICIYFCCSPAFLSIDSLFVCCSVRMTFKCQAHGLRAAFRNILKGYTREWKLKDLGVLPEEPQSISGFGAQQGKMRGNINNFEKKQKRILMLCFQ